MHPHLLAVAFEAGDPAEPARFWAELLGREVLDDAGGLLLPGDDTQLGLRFVPGRDGHLGANQMHLHLTTTDLDDQRHTVAAALGLGARHLDVGQRPEEGHVVLAGPAGYEFCVIEPDNAYLDGCGRLGELTCDGSRLVGQFWRDALGWPLVWDQRLELLASTNLPEAVAALASLGAAHLGDREDGSVELADPDGYEFVLRPPRGEAG